MQRFFSHLVKEGIIPLSPTTTVDRPRKVRKPKHYVRPDEYTKLLASAGGNARDFALLQLFLQTGIRVSEAVSICVHDLELEHKTLTIHGSSIMDKGLQYLCQLTNQDQAIGRSSVQKLRRMSCVCSVSHRYK